MRPGTGTFSGRPHRIGQTSSLNRLHFCVRQHPVQLLRRVYVCCAGDAPSDDAPEETDPAMPPLPMDNEPLPDGDEMASESSDPDETEANRRADFVKEYFQSRYDPMYKGKWVDVQGAEMKMPDYDFSNYDWMSRVPTDIGWPMFWECASCIDLLHFAASVCSGWRHSCPLS